MSENQNTSGVNVDGSANDIVMEGDVADKIQALNNLVNAPNDIHEALTEARNTAETHGINGGSTDEITGELAIKGGGQRPPAEQIRI